MELSGYLNPIGATYRPAQESAYIGGSQYLNNQLIENRG